MEIIPVNPSSNDFVSFRIFGNTPSNVVSATTEWVIMDSVIILNTIVNLGQLTVIGTFETILEIGSLNTGYYFAIVL